MREIKYRAWDGKEFYSPILAEGLMFRSYRDYEDFEHADDVLMQFTGLKDKNSKDIYEGDIVQAFNTSLDNEKGNNEVIFDNGCFKLRKPNVNDIPIGSYKQNEIEVVGNVFDMPDWDF